MRKGAPFILSLMVTFVLFWQFFVRGFVPMPASFMAAWYEPWRSEHASNGVPTIPHKAVGDDVFRQIYPFRTLAFDMMRNGKAPLWNPYGGAGQPLFATLHTGIANPFSVVQVLGHVPGWAWFIILQLPLLVVSVYWYMRTIGVSVYGSCVSAVVLSLSGVAVSRYIYGDYLYALAALPVLLGVVERARAYRRWMFGIPLLVAFVLISVQPQISVYVLVTFAVYVLVRDRKQYLSYGVFTLLGVGISAIQLLPTLELYGLANVSATSSAFIFEKFLMPVSHLLTIAIPNFFGNIGTYNFWGKTDYIETAASLGLLPVGFSLVAVLRTSRNKTLSDVTGFFFWVGLVSIVFTLDWAGTRLLYRIPIPVLSTSIPTRMYLLTTLAGAILSGIGADRWHHAGGKEGKYINHTFLWVFAWGVVIALVVFIMKRFALVACPETLPLCLTVTLRNTLLEVGVITLGAIVLFIHGRVWRIPTYLTSTAVLLIMIGSGVYNGWKFLPMSPPEYVEANHPLLRALSLASPRRVAGLGAGRFATDVSTQYRYQDTNYYDPLYIRRYGELVSYVNTGTKTDGLTRSDVEVVADATVSAELAARRETFWDMTGTAYLVTKQEESLPLTGEVVWQDALWSVTKRASALPRAYLVGEVVVPSGDNALLAALFSPGTDLRRVAFVEHPEQSFRGNTDAVGAAEIVRYEANEVRILVKANNEAVLVLSDTWYPGWYAKVNGKPAEVLRANYAFRAVRVPNGASTVVFSYQPISVRAGMWVSGIALSLWLIWFLLAKGMVKYTS